MISTKPEIISNRETTKPTMRSTVFGKIKERIYMGGEVSYFVELENGTVIHIIGIVKTKPFRRGDPVAVTVPRRHCKLLRKEE